MFRPWYNDPQPDFAGAARYNNVQAGNRVNINNFNAYPRTFGGLGLGGGLGGVGGINGLGSDGIRAAPIFSQGPGLHDFAHLFNLASPGPALHSDGRLRNRLTVLMPDGARVLLDRDVMHDMLPRTRNAVPGAFFAVPEFLQGYDHGLEGNIGFDPRGFEQAFAAAAAFVFRYVEMLCRPPFAGQHQGGLGFGIGGGVGSNNYPAFDLFARPRYLLANARDRVGTVHEIFWHVFLLCCVLDQDRALGCSEPLARSIGEFLVEFAPRVEAFMPPGAVQFLFVGYARIFRETPFESQVLRELWDVMDVVDQTSLRNLIGPQLARGGMGSNAHRVWTALRHLGLV
ncbi:hypothetical protein CMUS01_02504 [Colletotrichum musicola]|uniref:Uncharacterized protein n=1 Tax=Colletotrichum musicola TaxID=2175873 RepID=A0A8H6NUV4_9PEZI|nr:hypothetical protein CMUS01_02504 [Colletotrichum musicola]